MRLGAFLQYNRYTVRRHQRVGRSTCRVHPCKQENKVMPKPVPQEVPYLTLPRQYLLRYSPVLVTCKNHPSPGGHMYLRLIGG